MYKRERNVAFYVIISANSFIWVLLGAFDGF